MSTTAHEKNARAWPSKHVKRSKSQRKYLNEMRAMGEVPWPARRFKYPAMFAVAGVVGSCSRPVLERQVLRPGWRGKLLRRRDAQSVVCGGPLELVANRRVRCRACRQRQRALRRISRSPVLQAQLRDELRRVSGRGSLRRRLFSRKAS